MPQPGELVEKTFGSQPQLGLTGQASAPAIGQQRRLADCDDIEKSDVLGKAIVVDWPESWTERFGEWLKGYIALPSVLGLLHVTFQTAAARWSWTSRARRRLCRIRRRGGGGARYFIEAFGGARGAGLSTTRRRRRRRRRRRAASPPPPARSQLVLHPMVMKALQTDIKDRWAEMKVEAQRKAQLKGTAGGVARLDDWPSLYKDFDEYLALRFLHFALVLASAPRTWCARQSTFRPEAEMEALSAVSPTRSSERRRCRRTASAAKERFAAICDANKEASHHFRQEAKAVTTADWINLGRKMREEEKR